MGKEAIFHKFVQRDMNGIIRYYADEAGMALADRFYVAFIVTVEKALKNPEHFHPLQGVLRHEKRHPSYGMRRR